MVYNMLIVSKCLIGECCRYDGGSKPDAEIVRLVRAGKATAVCPEQLGGLSTPRPPSEIAADGRVISKTGADVTKQFVRGANEALRIARAVGATRAILKARSPSCGCGEIYDGTFSGTLTQGDGITAALFKANGIDVESR